jgi:hypothetical protein
MERRERLGLGCLNNLEEDQIDSIIMSKFIILKFRIKILNEKLNLK